MINIDSRSPKLLVIGDLMIDNYLWGKCERISPEAPVQVIKIDSENSVLGGAGNVINNLKSLGASVDVISVIGGCAISDELKNLLNSIEVDSKFLITQHDRTTSKKTRIIAAQQQVARYDRESVDEINTTSQRLIIDIFKKIISKYDAVLLSDYGKGVLTSNLTQSVIKIANKVGKKVIVDPKGKDYSKYKDAYLLTPNLKEASQATKIVINNDKDLNKAIIKLKSELNLNVSLITLSEKGIAIYDNDLRVHPTSAREVFDVTGAGDTVLASLGYALANNVDIDSAVKFANLAAGVVVGKIGSATASFNEIIEYESSLKKSSSNEHIKTLSEISSLSKDLRSRDKKIVFTNGCFDLLHIGHVKYLEIARSFGDILILGLNSDKSIQSIKGKNRPIQSESDRAYILAALEAVDYVVIFDEDTPYNLINNIKPHILVKGGDYTDKEVVGQNLVDELRLVDYIEGKSTSKTINKIQSEKK